MSLVYRTNGSWGTGKGSPLTSAEADGNISQLNVRLATVEGALPAAAKGISSISASGPLMTIHYTDSTTSTVTMPVVTYTYRGTWTPSTSYAVNDQFTYNGSFYQVLITHTSGLTFDPFATNGLGSDLYALLMSNPGATLPTGGATDMVLGKISGTDFSVSWRQSGVPRAGATSSILCKSSTSDYDTTWLAKTSFTLPFTQLTGVATSAQIPAAGATIGGVFSLTASGSQFVTGCTTSGTLTTRQPAFTDLTGIITLAQKNVPSVTLTPAGTVTIDCTLGEVFLLTPTTDSLFIPNGTPDGARVTLVITTSGTTSYDMDFAGFSSYIPDLFTGKVSGKQWVIEFVSDGFTWYEVSRTELHQTFNFGTTGGFPIADQTLASTFKITPNAATQINSAGLKDSHVMTIIITTSGTTSYNVTWGVNMKSQGTLATGTVSGKVFTVTFVCDGVFYNEISRTTAM